MRKLWVGRTMAAPATATWGVLTDVARWSEWGPTVRGAELAGDGFGLGARGWVVTPLGVRLPFEVTTYEPEVSWAWEVAGIPATEHRVQDLGGGTSRVGFGVPVVAAPYLAVCRVALHRIERLVTSTTS